MKLLLVENHEQFLRIVEKKFLSDCTITSVTSIANVWEKLSIEGYDAVLVDYDLDDGKGDELIKKVKKASLSVKTVAISAHDRGNTALKEAGADAICSKMGFQNIGHILKALVKAIE